MKQAVDATTSPHRVVLVFGNPGNGKSYLAKALREQFGYVVVSLDDEYVRFIKEQFPSLLLPALGQVIAQHFQFILCAAGGGAAAQKWANYLTELVGTRSLEHRLLVVEGFLLEPALAQVRQALPATTVITVVEVKQGQYFVAQALESIHTGGASNDRA